MEEIPILIVGAGPTGLTCAAELVRQGVIDFWLVDALLEQQIQTKATGLFARSVEILASYENVVETLEKRAVVGASTKIMKDFTTAMAEVNLAMYTKSNYKNLFVEQWYTEQALYGYLSKFKGPNFIKRGHKVIAIEECLSEGRISHIVTIEITENSTITVKKIKARFIVACDGGRSSVRKLLNIDFKGYTEVNGFVGMHFTGTLGDYTRDTMRIFLTRDGMGVAMPLPENSWFVTCDLTAAQEEEFLSKTEEDAYGGRKQLTLTPEQNIRWVKERFCPSAVVERINWTSHYKVNERLAERYSNGKQIFLAGDAVHCHTPLGGQGMNTGIQDGMNIGWKLAMVVKGVIASVNLLGTYEEERIVIGKNLLAFTSRGQSGAQIRNPVLQALRNAVLSATGHTRFLSEAVSGIVTETGLNYQNARLSVEHWQKPGLLYFFKRRDQNILRLGTTRVKAGDRWRPDGLQSVPFNFVTATPGFKLVFFEGLSGYINPTTHLNSDEIEIVGNSLKNLTGGVVTGCVTVSSSEVESYRKVGVLGQSVFVLRPDGYVGFRCEPIDSKMILGYFKEALEVKNIPSTVVFKPVKHDWLQLTVFGSLFVAVVAVIVVAVKM